MSNNSERRRFSRVGFESGITLIQDDHHYPAQLVDLSLHGALVELNAEHDLLLTESVVLQLPLNEETMITINTRPLRLVNNQLALECEQIDVDSISHLRRLIELNTGNPIACERELSELISNH